jgi:peptidyl-prolyl cis-trans isomerase C
MRMISATTLSRVSIAAAVTLSLAACNKQQPAADATPAQTGGVATVDGKVITRADYDFYLKQVTRGQPPPVLTAEQKTEVINELVGMQILATQAVNDKVDADADVAASLEVTRLHILADAESQKFLKTKAPTDQELHDEYNTAVAGLDKTEYHAHHILVDTKEQAEQLLKKIKAGAKFEDVAKAQSKDAGSKARGGDLDWFQPARMVKPFADALKTLKKGEITPEPIESKFGWHIIRLDDTRELQPPPFEQVKETINNRVIQKRLAAYVEDLKKTAKIEITPPADAPAPAAAAPGPATAAPAAPAAAPAAASAAKP